jgi:hypothetical protein
MEFFIIYLLTPTNTYGIHDFSKPNMPIAIFQAGIEHISLLLHLFSLKPNIYKQTSLHSSVLQRGRMSQKRGQLTLFIVIGLLLVVALILVVFFTRETTLRNILPEGLIPTKTGAIERFIEGCIELTGNDGVSLMGAQGGYIYLPPQIENNPLAHINQGLKVPYWQFQQENRIPSLPLMESHLNRYISENLKSCLDNLDAFQQEYTIIEKGDVITQTRIREEDVTFTITYPIEVIDKDGNKITDVETYFVGLDIRLRHMMEVGRAIMETEALQQKFERLTIDLYALDPAIPTSGTDIQCGRKTWLKTEIEEKLKTLLRTNLPQVRVDYTTYNSIPDSLPYMQNHYVWRVTPIAYPDITTSFTFIENPFRLSVRPSSGNTLRSNQLKGQDLASFLCLQQWNFVYDVEFPVMVGVEDNLHNVVLNFGFIVRIQNNRESREPLSARQSLAPGTTEDGDAYCANTYGGYNMRVYTRDNITDPNYGHSDEPINDVEVSFTCLKYSCTMGTSHYIDNGNNAVVDSVFPYCQRGLLRGAKPGYKEAQTFVTVTNGGEATLYLNPLKIIRDYSIVKHSENDGVISAGRGLDSDETVFITLRYRSENSTDHETWGGYPPTKDTELQPIEMLAGASFPIELEIFVMNDNTIIGGYQTEWQPRWRELEQTEKIEFHVVTTEVSSDNDMAAFLARLPELSNDDALQPVLMG